MINWIEEHKLEIAANVEHAWNQRGNGQEIANEKIIDMIYLFEQIDCNDEERRQQLCQLYSQKYEYFQDTVLLVQLVEEAVLDAVLKSNTHSVEKLSIFLKENYKKMHDIERSLVKEYEHSYKDAMNMQRIALKELSTPIIPILDKISVLPLVGTIDTTRAKLIIENVLEGVLKHKSEVLLIDITGVPVIDTMVTHHIIQAVKAVKLLGTTCIIVGIRPEIAQTIVSLGIDLDEFMTAGTLQRGVEEALRLTKRKISEV